MAQAIRVVVTQTYTYTPNLNEEGYKEHGCISLDDALIVDRRDVESGDFSLEEIATVPPVMVYEWSIVDE